MKTTAPSEETIALMRILAFGEQQVQEGKIVPLTEASAKLRAQLAARQNERQQPAQP